MQSREPLKAQFYDSELWKEELETIVLLMIEKYDVVVVAAGGGVGSWR
jgi:hypothetical protein